MAIKRNNNGNRKAGNSKKERIKFDVVLCDEDRYTFTPSLGYQKLTNTQVASILCDALIGTTKNADNQGNINFTFTSANSGHNLGFLNGVNTDLTEDSTIEERKAAILEIREILCSIEPDAISKTKNAEERHADVIAEFGE